MESNGLEQSAMGSDGMGIAGIQWDRMNGIKWGDGWNRME